MTVLATMLTGGGRAKVASDAVRSVAFCDAILFIRTDDTSDETIASCIPVCEELGLTVHVATFVGKWDCATARNFALLEAERLGYSFAMTIDTDERFVTHGVDIKGQLGQSDHDVILVNIEGGGYPKERFFRMPPRGAFFYRIHEAYIDGSTFELMVGPTFTEVEKTQAEQIELQRAVKRICLEEIESGVNPSRHYMYLGISEIVLGDRVAAKSAFVAAAGSADYEEQHGRNMFLAACECHALGEWDEAIDLAHSGTRSCPDHPDLWGAMAYAAHQLGQSSLNGEERQKWFHLCATWCDIAIGLGLAQPRERVQRIQRVRSFGLFPIAQYEWPWQIRAAALAGLGYNDQAAQAHRIAQWAEQLRKGSERQ